MANTLDIAIPKEEQEEIQELQNIDGTLKCIESILLKQNNLLSALRDTAKNSYLRT